MLKHSCFSFLLLLFYVIPMHAGQWIRINQLGYLPQATKVAVLMSDEQTDITSFQLVDVFTRKVVHTFSGTLPAP